MNKRLIGKIKEDEAIKYLIDNGYKIIDRNFYTRLGEIDIIAKDNDTICFIEVKYRRKNTPYLGVEAVNKNKIKKIRSTAKMYIYKKALDINNKYRFDVLSIDGDKITFYKGAF